MVEGTDFELKKKILHFVGYKKKREKHKSWAKFSWRKKKMMNDIEKKKKLIRTLVRTLFSIIHTTEDCKLGSMRAWEELE